MDVETHRSWRERDKGEGEREGGRETDRDTHVEIDGEREKGKETEASYSCRLHCREKKRGVAGGCYELFLEKNKYFRKSK